MKTFVRVKADYKDKLLGGELYELISTFKTDEVRSGLGVIIKNGDGIEVYDSNFFE